MRAICCLSAMPVIFPIRLFEHDKGQFRRYSSKSLKTAQPLVYYSISGTNPNSRQDTQCKRKTYQRGSMGTDRSW